MDEPSCGASCRLPPISRRTARDGDDGVVNWTKLAHELNVSPCDVLQVLDCCFAATATKGDNEKRTAELIGASNMTTQLAEFNGRNETLASCGRDYETWAGRLSSMPLFADVLSQFVPEGKSHPDFVTVDHWYHAIDSQVYKSMRLAAGGHAKFWRTPYRKMNPIHHCQDSIRLWTKSGVRAQKNDRRR